MNKEELIKEWKNISSNYEIDEIHKEIWVYHSGELTFRIKPGRKEEVKLNTDTLFLEEIQLIQKTMEWLNDEENK